MQTRARRDPPPQVTGVFVGSTAWTSAFRSGVVARGEGEAAFGHRLDPAEQTRTLGYSNLNQVSVRFSEHVNVTPGC